MEYAHTLLCGYEVAVCLSACQFLSVLLVLRPLKAERRAKRGCVF